MSKRNALSGSRLATSLGRFDKVRRPSQLTWHRFRGLAVRFQKFLAIGAGGFAINIVGLYLLTDRAHIYYVLAALLAIQLSLLFTFLLNEKWTWKDRRHGGILNRYLRYQMVNGLGIGINISVLFALTFSLEVQYLLSNFVGAGLAAIWNFAANNLFTWNRNVFLLRGAL